MRIADYILMMRFELLTLLLLVSLFTARIFYGNKRPSGIIFLVNATLFIIAVSGLVMPSEGSLFGDMFISGKVILFEKSLLAFATLLISMQANDRLKRDSNNYHEFYFLLLSVLIGMQLMISSGHFLMFYLGLEMATIPLAALAGFDFEKGRSGEAAVKMILSSAFSSAILLFGLSLLYGACGSLRFSEMAASFNPAPLPLLGFAFLIAGFAFKISVVPFHFWTADVYEGAPVPVTTFMSVVSKGAAVFIFVTVLYKVFGGIHEHWKVLLSVLSAATMTLGNFFAMRQQNIKRFLAFSSITQAGYLLAGVAAGTQQSMASVIYFILVYIFSNIAAFTVVSVVSEKTGKENIDGYKGLYHSNPLLGLVMLLGVFSLAGIPPTAGFFGKFFLLASASATGMTSLVVIACLNMIFSLFYYLRIVKAMFVDKGDSSEKIEYSLSAGLVMTICAAGVLATGFYSAIYHYILSLSSGI